MNNAYNKFRESPCFKCEYCKEMKLPQHLSYKLDVGNTGVIKIWCHAKDDAVIIWDKNEIKDKKECLYFIEKQVKEVEIPLYYLLMCLMEELAEVIYAASKGARFGLNRGHPKNKTTNEDDIIIDFIDVLAVMDMIKEYGFLNKEVLNIEELKEQKIKAVKYFYWLYNSGKTEEEMNKLCKEYYYKHLNYEIAYKDS